MLAGMTVSAAEPGGLWGALKEAFASSSALAAAKSNAGSNELIKAVVADFETKGGRLAVQEALRQHLAGAKGKRTPRKVRFKHRETHVMAF